MQLFTLPCLFSSESGQPICGNGMVEQGEECDCGYSDQCKDECCFDANQPEGRKCKLKPGKQCRYLANFSDVNILVQLPECSCDKFKIEMHMVLKLCFYLFSFSEIVLVSALLLAD